MFIPSFIIMHEKYDFATKHLQSSYLKRVTQNNTSGKRETLTVEWLNIWKQSNEQTNVFPNVVSETLTVLT